MSGGLVLVVVAVIRLESNETVNAMFAKQLHLVQLSLLRVVPRSSAIRYSYRWRLVGLVYITWTGPMAVCQLLEHSTRSFTIAAAVVGYDIAVGQ